MSEEVSIIFMAQCKNTFKQLRNIAKKLTRVFVRVFICGIMLCSVACVCYGDEVDKVIEPNQTHSNTYDTRATNTHSKHSLYLIYENDSNFDSRVDKYYTAGSRLAYYSKTFGLDSRANQILRYFGIFSLFHKDENLSSFSVNLSQEIYAPKDRFSPIPPANDHPYGGFLYAQFGAINKSSRFLEQFELSLGMVGKASLAQQTQNLIHKLTNNKLLAGWDTQLKNEFIFNLFCRISYRYAFSESLARYLDMMPQASFALGNAKIFAQLSLITRFGYNLSPHTLSLNQNSGFASAPIAYTPHISIYGFVGVGGRVVGRNIFLEGNSFAKHRTYRTSDLTLDSALNSSFDVERVIGEFIWGVALDYKCFHIGYSVIHRSKEFSTQDGFLTYGSIMLGVSF